jgi:hypothetical protein
MNHTLAGPSQHWQLDLERRAAQAAEQERVERLLAELPEPATPLSRPQLLGMAITCGLIGALAALVLVMSLNLHLGG